MSSVNLVEAVPPSAVFIEHFIDCKYSLDIHAKHLVFGFINVSL